jgi:nitronate monooxygenase
MAALDDAELAAFLNRMLEAERAGAKALVVFMNDWPRHSPEWDSLRSIHLDEAHNCAIVGEMLKRAGASYSHATGEFYDKAVAVTGGRERIAFLVKGLRWAIREFESALPRIQREDVRSVLENMRERHRRSIAACEALVR